MCAPTLLNESAWQMNNWAEGQECGEGRGGKNFRSSLALASSGPNKNEPESGKAPYEQWELL